MFLDLHPIHYHNQLLRHISNFVRYTNLHISRSHQYMLSELSSNEIIIKYIKSKKYVLFSF